ncbi:MBOAT family O-acyltransferase [Faecalibaculum rodentium]|uniref:MBOAT family O-acyltransferase n=1 Tax=Faecalibaculum rodentium TaxID=1702221 RepID=UPI00272B313E|nr:MBOAT family O-acyltransferase [Faecalibaculum rodentium]
MSFTNLLFLTAFLPLSVLGYRALKTDTSRNILLVVLSWLFYAWAGLQGLVLLLIETCWIWFAGRALEDESDANRKPLFWTAAGGLLVILGLYKYLDPILTGLGLRPLGLPFPLGISFYTFTALSYLADVYTRRCTAQTDFLKLALYLSFFPKMAQGPIIQYHEMEPELSTRTVTFQDIGSGSLQFTRGLAKKVILADGLGKVFAALQANTTWAGAWVLSLAYAFQLYFDFSGYSDMAIGMGRWFGFHIPENFDHPYRSVSVRDFWRRWHIALSGWFRDYVYIPLGGSREGTKALIRNLLIVWLLTGIWHGANLTYVVWGLYYGLLIIAERFWFQPYLEKLPRWGRVILIFLIADIGWVFFAAPDLVTAFARLGRMFGIGVTGLTDDQTLFWLRTNALLFLLAFAFSGSLFQRLQDRILRKWKMPAVLGMAVFWSLILLICLAALVAGTSRTFLYFAF